MDFRLNEVESDIRDLFARFFAEQSPSARVRSAEPLGFDGDMWKHLASIGAVGMGLPKDLGGDGDGAGLVALALAAEQMGRYLAPVPLIDVATAARILARSSSSAARDWLELVVSGDRVLSLALRPVVGGVSHLVPSGAIAHGVIALRADQLILAEIAGDPPRRGLSNLGSMPVADCEVASEPLILAEGDSAFEAFEAAIDEWKVLTGASLVGLSQQAFEIALDYVKVRKAFGTPIGAFQTVAHRLADTIVQIDGCRFLCYEAAWATEARQQDASALASMAFLYGTETAKKATNDSLHFHGGVGFTMEHDIQLYFRRAKAWPLIYDDPRREYQRLADRLFGPREKGSSRGVH